MIALVRGQVGVRRPDHVVVDVNGVGYRLAVSAETLGKVPAVGKDVTLHSHLILRDDAIQLYGFATEEERELFLLLLGVQSVGPKMALGVLRGGPPPELTGALAAGDRARFQAVPGIGQRTAERIVVELRGKVDAPSIVVTRGEGPVGGAREGLSALGSPPATVEQLPAAAEGETVEELIQSALKVARR